MNSKDIRFSFIKFFEKKAHKYIRSSSVAPLDDPTLLFTNAGMNQFKPIFLDEIIPQYKRAVNSQKCIRVSGKHNDLEEVGVDSFHHTFFEMLGNWSFGDYYKKEAIKWSWELFTTEWKLDKSRLWVTVYEEDTEAYDLWIKETDIDPERVLRAGKKDNFWEMGETGPCGPCSEIHYFVGKDLLTQDASGVNSSDEYWELWNLVFIQNNRLIDGTLETLPNKHVDTGAGLERITSVLQGKDNNYKTDLFYPIIKSLAKIAKSSYDKNPIPHNVIADHIRMLCFSIADGAIPSNEGRGYVLRRILRRALRFGRKLNLNEPFLFKLVPIVSEIMGSVYPEVLEKKSYIETVLKSEEKAFNNTLDKGLIHFEKVLLNIDNNTIPGNEAFKLYDTYGFPLDLTQLIAKERGFNVDTNGFDKSMSLQKSKAKSSGKFRALKKDLKWEVISDNSETKFVGYDLLKTTSEIIRFSKKDENIYLVLDQTPFYAESGGQVSDIGTIRGDKINLNVISVIKENETFIHICEGVFGNPSTVSCEVNIQKRSNVKRNHTATHLLHKALKVVLGNHVNQAGSLVESDYLRFDLTHFKKITDNELNKIERIINDKILENIQLESSITSFDDAKNQGAEALFGEKYGDEVRVVQVSDFSKELCGGTHVSSTGDIGSFKIKEEASLSSGVRRIVAITGKKSVLEMQKNEQTIKKLQSILNSTSADLVIRVEQLLSEKKEIDKKLKENLKNNLSYDFTQKYKTINNYKVLIEKITEFEGENIKMIGDQVYNQLKSGIGIVFVESDTKPAAVIIVSKDLNKIGVLAGKLAKDIGRFMGGGGGGKPHLATAGGKEGLSFDKVLEKSEEYIINLLKG